MLDLRGQARFAQKAVAGVLAGNAGADDLDDAWGVEIGVDGAIDLAHPARAEALHDAVLVVEQLRAVTAGGGRGAPPPPGGGPGPGGGRPPSAGARQRPR